MWYGNQWCFFVALWCILRLLKVRNFQTKKSSEAEHDIPRSGVVLPASWKMQAIGKETTQTREPNNLYVNTSTYGEGYALLVNPYLCPFQDGASGVVSYHFHRVTDPLKPFRYCIGHVPWNLFDTVWDRMWDLIVSVPDHCLPFYFPDFHDTLVDLLTVTRWQFTGKTPYSLIYACVILKMFNLCAFPCFGQNIIAIVWQLSCLSTTFYLIC